MLLFLTSVDQEVDAVIQKKEVEKGGYDGTNQIGNQRAGSIMI